MLRNKLQKYNFNQSRKHLNQLYVVTGDVAVEDYMFKALNFDNFDNSHNCFLWPEYFIDFFMWKMDPMSGCNIRLVFTLAPRDSTLQYKRWIYFWNNFPCITFLSKYYLLGMLLPINEYSVHFTLHSTSGLQYTVSGSKCIFCTLYITFYIRPLVHCIRK